MISSFRFMTSASLTSLNLISNRVEKSAYFRREGADIHTDAEISLSQAVLGGTIRVQGVYEDQVIQVCTASTDGMSVIVN